MKLLKLTLHKPFLFFYFLLFYLQVPAQIFPVKNYPQGYFSYPVGTQVGLSANFGELRANHYHMGLDCKTDGKQNLPVFAAAEGYIAKVKIDASGFGRAIYINHPNGLTTLYAHLNNFFPGLEKYVKEQQYKQERWDIFIDIPAGIFPLQKGDFIAYSGNTGGSQGPHVHFEIRDTKTDKVLNPLLFGFPLKDNVPPSIVRLAVYDRCISVYSQTPKILSLRRVNGIYVPVSPLITMNTDRVSFGISAFDTYTGSTNNNGIFEADLYDNDDPVVGFQLDSISYDETRYLNAHIDYKLRMAGGPFIQHLSRLPGYPAGVYQQVSGDGVIDVTDDSVHHVKVVVLDAYGNASTLQFQVQRGYAKAALPAANTVSYFQPTAFHPGFINVFETDDIQVILGEHDLYDSIMFSCIKKNPVTSTAVSFLYAVSSGLVPVHGYFTVKIKPSPATFISPDAKVVMQRTWGAKTEVIKAKLEAGWYTAQFRYFGGFQLLVDSIPPTIQALGLKQNANISGRLQLNIVVKDNNREIKNFRAELDGSWLRFTNDKELSFIYKFDEMCPPGPHELKISAEDEAGNAATQIFHFSR